MGRGLNVLPVTHDFAPGYEPDVVEIVLGVFGGEWKTEQVVVVVFFALLAVALLNFFISRARRRREVPPPAGMVAGDAAREGMGDSLRALRQSRMSGGLGPTGSAKPLLLDKENLVRQ